MNVMYVGRNKHDKTLIIACLHTHNHLHTVLLSYQHTHTYYHSNTHLLISSQPEYIVWLLLLLYDMFSHLLTNPNTIHHQLTEGRRCQRQINAPTRRSGTATAPRQKPTICRGWKFSFSFSFLIHLYFLYIIFLFLHRLNNHRVHNKVNKKHRYVKSCAKREIFSHNVSCFDHSEFWF